MSSEASPEPSPPRPATRPPTSDATGPRRATLPPVLASDALREALAPIEPGARRLRFGYGALALLVLSHVALAPHAGWALPVLASVALTTAACAPLGYATRGILAVVASSLVFTGCDEGALTNATEWARGAAATLIPAALLFRAHYPAFRRGRIALAAALALATPLAIAAATTLANESRGATRAGAAVALVALVLAVLALAGTPSRRGAFIWAGAHALALGVNAALCDAREPAAAALAAATFVLASIAGGLGFFQVSAARFARDARKVDVHGAAGTES